MAVFKCKMCGGELDVREGQTIVTCDYCGTKQTVPADCSEELRTLYNRANVLRMKSEFDKAEQIYERIITAEPKQAEAYWGALLCKYGIEYVEDPKTYKRIPTCHRVSYDVMGADEYYKLALENADSVQRRIYEEEAKYIDGVQKEILAISSKEEAFDVFICYKETDENGKRTKDSTIANDIYYQLTQEGYRVFYAAITLEDKLGSAYEPVIFAALNSAKVMLVLGTRPEYFNAVWVKNEWSRYLKLIKNDNNKLLIPCYQDMDAYELPEEFAHLQAQDMGKVGFIADIVRGIKKVIGKEDRAKESVISVNGSAAPLLKRAYMFAAEKDWNNANQYAERVLDIEPENAEAYIVKLLCDLKVPTVEELGKQLKPFTNNANFKKAEKFADDKIAALLKQLVESSNNAIYEIGSAQIECGNIKENLEGIATLGLIAGWRNSSQLRDKCYGDVCESTANLLQCIKEIARIKIPQEEKVLFDNREKSNFLSEKIVFKKGVLFCIKEDGTVFATGNDVWAPIINKVTLWDNILSLAVEDEFVVGLKADGTVIAVGDNKFNQCDVENWTDITRIVTGDYYTCGLRANGTVVITESAKNAEKLKSWHDIVYLATDKSIIVGVTSSGKVLVAGDDDLSREVAEWNNIVEVFIDNRNIVGLKNDGTVIAARNKNYKKTLSDWILKEILSWKGIISICGSRVRIMGLKQDGTVVVAQPYYKSAVTWSNILAVSSDGESFAGVNDSGKLIFSDNNVDSTIRYESSHLKLFDNIESAQKAQLRLIEEAKAAYAINKLKSVDKLQKVKEEYNAQIKSLEDKKESVHRDVLKFNRHSDRLTLAKIDIQLSILGAYKPQDDLSKAKKYINQIEDEIEAETQQLNKLKEFKKFRDKYKLFIAMLILTAVSALITFVGLAIVSTTFVLFVIGIILYFVLSLMCGYFGGRLSNFMQAQDQASGLSGCFVYLIICLVYCFYIVIGWVPLLVKMYKFTQQTNDFISQLKITGVTRFYDVLAVQEFRIEFLSKLGDQIKTLLN